MKLQLKWMGFPPTNKFRIGWIFGPDNLLKNSARGSVPDHIFALCFHFSGHCFLIMGLLLYTYAKFEHNSLSVSQ